MGHEFGRNAATCAFHVYLSAIARVISTTGDLIANSFSISIKKISDISITEKFRRKRCLRNYIRGVIIGASPIDEREAWR